MNKKKIDDIAKANTGFSVGLPAIILSDKVVGELPQIRTLMYVSLDVATQTRFIFHYLGKVLVRVVEEDKVSESIAYALYYPGRKYSLLSDMLLDDLGIVLLEPGRGYWRFRDDPEDKIRETVHKPKFNLKDILEKEGLL